MGAKMSRVYTTSAGIEIAIKPISTRTLDDLALQYAEIEKVRPPTYTVKILDGDATEEIEHDETTLNTDEDRAAWTDYVTRLNAAVVAFNEFSAKTIITFGIDGEPAENGWEKDFEFCGISVPKGAAERKVFYYQRVVLTDPLDEQLITRQINLISRLSGEALERADALFRGAVETNGGVDSAEQATGKAGPVETQ